MQFDYPHAASSKTRHYMSTFDLSIDVELKLVGLLVSTCSMMFIEMSENRIGTSKYANQLALPILHLIS